MRLERVVDAPALVHREREPEFLAARTNTFLVDRELLRCRAVLLRDVLGNVLSFRWHVWIQLERLQMNVRSHSAIDATQRLLQRPQADHAPRAGDVRNKVDLQ